MKRFRRALYFLALIVLTLPVAAQQPQISNYDRDRAQEMLKVIGDEVRQHYYDPQFHGLNWETVLEQAKSKIAKASSLDMSLSHIAAALDALNDSHTFFLPPRLVVRANYGFQYQMIGDRCFVTRVRPQSHAEEAGVKPGDEILTINGYSVSRDTLWKMQYVFSVLRPQPGLRLSLQDLSGGQRKVDVAAVVHQDKGRVDYTNSFDGWEAVRKLENGEHFMRARYAEYGDALLILKVPEFSFSVLDVEEMIGKARKHQNLIVDLRGNPGGSVETLKYLVGGMFDKEVKIADRMGRKETKAEVAKPLHNPFTGKLVVLTDSKSASAAELFARVIQLEKRGVVIGDHTSGSVMEARHYDEHLGFGTVVFYGASITEWNLIMADGKSLEHTGVTPDVVLLQSAQDLSGGRDPVLSRAAEILGVKVAPEEAGKLFPYEWPPE